MMACKRSSTVFSQAISMRGFLSYHPIGANSSIWTVMQGEVDTRRVTPVPRYLFLNDCVIPLRTQILQRVGVACHFFERNRTLID